MLKYTRNTVIAFDFKDALSFEGETGPYIQYAVVRARNIFRKGDTSPEAVSAEFAQLAGEAVGAYLTGEAAERFGRCGCAPAAARSCSSSASPPQSPRIWPGTASNSRRSSTTSTTSTTFLRKKTRRGRRFCWPLPPLRSASWSQCSAGWVLKALRRCRATEAPFCLSCARIVPIQGDCSVIPVRLNGQTFSGRYAWL